MSADGTVRRRRVPRVTDTTLFVLGLILAAAFGLEAGGVRLPGPGLAWWGRGLIILIGLAVIALSLRTEESSPAHTDDAGQRRMPLPPLPAPIPGTPFLGHVPDLPARFVTRADVFDPAQDDVVGHRTVALVGMGGAGKTVLAKAVAHDPGIHRTFSDGIVWVAAGQDATPTGMQE